MNLLLSVRKSFACVSCLNSKWCIEVCAEQKSRQYVVIYFVFVILSQ